MPSTTPLRLSTSRATTRWRPKPSSWRVRCIARSAALRISSASPRRGSSCVERADQEVAEAHDDHHHVVEVVGHAAREPPHRLHLLRLPDLLLRLDALGDVAAHPDDRRPPRRWARGAARGSSACGAGRAARAGPLVGDGLAGERPEVGPLVHGALAVGPRSRPWCGRGSRRARSPRAGASGRRCPRSAARGRAGRRRRRSTRPACGTAPPPPEWRRATPCARRAAPGWRRTPPPARARPRAARPRAGACARGGR